MSGPPTSRPQARGRRPVPCLGARNGSLGRPGGGRLLVDGCSSFRSSALSTPCMLPPRSKREAVRPSPATVDRSSASRCYISDLILSKLKRNNSMPPRSAHIPHAIERSALQRLLTGQALSSLQLHPAGKDTLAGLLKKGWIVSESNEHGLRYRITAFGEAAFKARIPTSKGGQK